MITVSDEPDILTEFTQFCPSGVGNQPVNTTVLLQIVMTYQCGYGS